MSLTTSLDMTLIVAFIAAALIAVYGLLLPPAPAPASGAAAAGGAKKTLTPLSFGITAASVVLGLILLRESYAVLAASPGMAPELYQIVRMTIGLAAGFIAAGLAGNFEIEGPISNISFKAGGPTGVAIFFYLVNPMSFTVAA